MGQALNTAEQAQRAAAASQTRVDQLDDQTRALLERFRAASWQAQQLTVYADQLEEIATRQADEKQSLQRQIEAMQRTEAELLPLMLRMLDTLARFVEMDLPFLATERRERLDNLERLMSDPEATLAEKYRRLLEAYQIEVDYGRGLGAERAEVDGRVVDQLRVGRLALFALTLEADRAWRWDAESGQWVDADSGLARSIRQGLRMARDTAPAGLLVLPVAAAEAVQP
ncbi:DUF3450 domain-containing protein [Flagellatimonas centrodinii]|uniref:DUF3450 domain-containing protein n=1 Tax=Flagellatimonas centrodinii TaxID=2806210 RepID=UPI003F502885